MTASECGAPQSGDGTPYSQREWAACREATIRLADEVNRIANELHKRGETVRLWVGGSAAVPVCFHLGLELSGWCPHVTFVHRDKHGTMCNFALDQSPSVATYFGPVEASQGAGEAAALVVSAFGTITSAEVARYEAVTGTGFGDVVKLHSPDRVTEETFGAACRELETASTKLPSGLPLTTFIYAPSPLAFALGRTLTRRRFGTIAAPRYDAPGYHPALIVPSGARRPSSPVLSVAYFSANPGGQQRLSLREEGDRIKLGLRDGRRRHTFESVTKTDPDSLMETLRRTTPSVLHFSGHGSSEGCIILESEVHGHARITPEMLATVIKHAGQTVRVVVLNACYSAAMAAALLDHVDCVIAISDAIDDRAAIAFSSDFYRDLGSKGVRAAYVIARNQMTMNGMPDADVVAIYPAPGVDLDDIWP
ncbi:MAG: CHAT domain-containing protein [Deltaproteobacteria bacterium]|nr:CHAT domain-containing protein [Deltaproteobacteria bacterium]